MCTFSLYIMYTTSLNTCDFFILEKIRKKLTKIWDGKTKKKIENLVNVVLHFHGREHNYYEKSTCKKSSMTRIMNEGTIILIRIHSHLKYLKLPGFEGQSK